MMISAIRLLLWPVALLVVDSYSFVAWPRMNRLRRPTSNTVQDARYGISLRSSLEMIDDDDYEDRQTKEGEIERIREILVNGDEDTIFQGAAADLASAPPPEVLFKKLPSSQSVAKVLVKGNEDYNKYNQRNSSSIVPTSISCRIVTASDGKIPTQRSLLPPSLQRPPQILTKIDAIYHAMAHEQTRFIKFRDTHAADSSDEDIAIDYRHDNSTIGSSSNEQPTIDDNDDEEKIISIIRHSLEDAGFELLTQRDLDLCQALNAEYLLRLSIAEDLAELDPSIASDFYPEKFQQPETQPSDQTTTILDSNLLYDGRVLIFWRGYGQEVTIGRLFLPKLDYLQASIVQRAASRIRVRLNVLEEAVSSKVKDVYARLEASALSFAGNVVDVIPSRRVSKWAGAGLAEMSERANNRQQDRKEREKMFKLSRYGGYGRSFASSPNNPSDALTPFIVCEVDYSRKANNDQHNSTLGWGNVNGNSTITNSGFYAAPTATVEHDIYEVMNSGKLTCQYDEEVAKADGKPVPPMQLLERISISNLIDFAANGPKSLVQTIFAKNELMEPTYREVIVIWRPLPEKPTKPVITPPKFAYEVADMFDLEGLPEPCERETQPDSRPLQIRAFAGVPMANLPAVLPKTKLVFRPADAFVFDLVSIVSLILLIGSQKFDNPRLDLLALVSFSLWLFRTVIRYSNKLARYDLLVKKFLTNKITHRNSGAVKYITTEASSYRATRAALVYTWLRSPLKTVTSAVSNRRDQLVRDGLLGVNDLIEGDKQVKVDIEAALKDLEDLDLIHFSEDGHRLESVVRDYSSVMAALSKAWADVFEEHAIPSATDSSEDAPIP